MSIDSSLDYIVVCEKLLPCDNFTNLTVFDKIHFSSIQEAKNWIRDMKIIDNQNKYVDFKIEGRLINECF